MPTTTSTTPLSSSSSASSSSSPSSASSSPSASALRHSGPGVAVYLDDRHSAQEAVAGALALAGERAATVNCVRLLLATQRPSPPLGDLLADAFPAARRLELLPAERARGPLHLPSLATVWGGPPHPLSEVVCRLPQPAEGAEHLLREAKRFASLQAVTWALPRGEPWSWPQRPPSPWGPALEHLSAEWGCCPERVGLGDADVHALLAGHLCLGSRVRHLHVLHSHSHLLQGPELRPGPHPTLAALTGLALPDHLGPCPVDLLLARLPQLEVLILRLRLPQDALPLPATPQPLCAAKLRVALLEGVAFGQHAPQLPELQDAVLRRCQLDDLSPLLAGCPRLRCLRLWDGASDTQLDAGWRAPQLRALELHRTALGCPAEPHPLLRQLVLRQCRVPDVQRLVDSMPSLVRLVLDACQLDLAATAAAGLVSPSIEELRADGQHLAGLSLAMPRLRSLHLRNCVLDDLGRLVAACPLLVVLYIDGSSVPVPDPGRALGAAPPSVIACSDDDDDAAAQGCPVARAFSQLGIDAAVEPGAGVQTSSSPASGQGLESLPTKPRWRPPPIQIPPKPKEWGMVRRLSPGSAARAAVACSDDEDEAETEAGVPSLSREMERVDALLDRQQRLQRLRPRRAGVTCYAGAEHSPTEHPRKRRKTRAANKERPAKRRRCS